MAKFRPKDLRNVALVGHSGSGKTSLAEAVLYTAGAIDRLGKVDEGATTMDYDPDEIRRQMSINASVAWCTHRGVKINLIDTPGYFDFVGEAKGALRVSDAAVMVVDAVAGVEVGTELFWDYVKEYNIPVAMFVNKIDRENASFDRTLEGLRARFGTKVVPFTIPIGEETNFKGVIDLVTMKSVVDGKEQAIPEDLMDSAKSARESLIEAAAEGDDDLLMKYLDGEELTDDEVASGLRKSVGDMKVIPLLCGSAMTNRAISPLLDLMVRFFPSPEDISSIKGKNPKTDSEDERPPKADAPFSALVFKTMADPYVGKLTLFRVYSGSLRSDSSTYNSTKGKSERIGQIFISKGKQQEAVDEVVVGDIASCAKLQETGTGDTLCDENNSIIFNPMVFPSPVYSVAVMPKAKGDEEKISTGLSRLIEEDPTLRVERNAETSQMIMSGMGEIHLDVITDRLKRKFGVDVVLEEPKVPYKETIRGTVKIEGKHKKQTGGRGQYGHVFIELEPLEPDNEFEFVDKIFGGSVPRQYIPAVEKGVREAMPEGILAGFPVTNVRVTLFDGSYHAVDSSEMAFKIAASMAFKKGCQQANPILLEPIDRVEVIVPEAFMGDVMGDLNKKRGRILGMDSRGGMQVISALVPHAEMRRYAIDLRSITQGRGLFTVEFDHYEEVPSNVAQDIINQVKKEKEA
jgi:elongation factor G